MARFFSSTLMGLTATAGAIGANVHHNCMQPKAVARRCAIHALDAPPCRRQLCPKSAHAGGRRVGGGAQRGRGRRSAGGIDLHTCESVAGRVAGRAAACLFEKVGDDAQLPQQWRPDGGRAAVAASPDVGWKYAQTE